MRGLITLVSDDQLDTYLKIILVFAYYGSTVSNRPKKGGGGVESGTLYYLTNFE